MAVTRGQLAALARANPYKMCVRLSDWQALTRDEKDVVRAGLDAKGIQVGVPARWDAAGNPQDPENPLPAADVVLVSDDHRWSPRFVIYLQAILDDPSSLPAITRDGEGEVIVDSTYKQGVRAAYKAIVDTEFDTRFPEEQP